jgi:predicted Zn-dependent protease
MIPPSFVSRVLLKIFCGRSVQALFMLLLVLLVSCDLQLLAQSHDSNNAILSRSRRDLEVLTRMDSIPRVGISASEPVPSETHKRKIPEKYDVTRIGERRVDHGLNMYSIGQEQAIGKRMAAELEGRCRLITDPMVTHYIADLGERLVRNSDAKIQFTIKVVDSDEINAFALPGGYFYVNTGLILAAQNEAELASVMAHEIAHVAARHATRNMTKVQLWNIVSIPMTFFGGPVGMAVRQISGIAFPMSVTKFSRDAEREADLLGIEYEYAAGYDPAAFVSFFERLKAREHNRNLMAKAFASHPMNRDRIERAEKEIDTMLPPRDEYVVDTSQFQEVQLRLLHLMNAMPVLHHHQQRPGGPVLRRRTTDSVPPESR